MTTIENRAHLSDAAGLLVAGVSGDEDAVELLLASLLEARDLRGALLLSRALYDAAALALQSELTATAEDGDDNPPALSYLVALSRHAGRVEGGPAVGG